MHRVPSDYRELLARQRDLDAVYVATPDHWRAPIAIAAMRAGKHVLGQKPMCHAIGETRRMAAAARNQGRDVGHHQQPVDGAHASHHPVARRRRDRTCSRGAQLVPYRPLPGQQGVERPADVQPVPADFDWDFWLDRDRAGVHRSYQPFSLARLVQLGCGSFGDMGCYSFAGLLEILELVLALAVEAAHGATCTKRRYPRRRWSTSIFPARGPHQPLRLSWYDGGLRPPRPPQLAADDDGPFRQGEEGVL